MIEENRIRISDAIKSLRPNAEFSMWGDDYSTIEWYSENIPKPTLQEVDAELQRLQAEYDRTDYRRQRVEAYPSIEEQLDLMFHGGYDVWRAQIQAIKDKFPK